MSEKSNDENLEGKKSSSLCNKQCEHCGKLMRVYKSEINRGKFVFCSVDCAKLYRRSKLVKWEICKNCGMKFKTINKEFCCIECLSAK